MRHCLLVPALVALALAPAMLDFGIARADETICRELEACCTGIYEEMQAAGNTVPPVNQCDFAFLVERPSPPPSSCQELLIYYREFANNLFESGEIMAVPAACTSMDPFTIEPGPAEAGDDDFEILPGPEEPEWTMESDPGESPPDDSWTMEPGPAEPEWSIEPGPGEPDWTIEPGPAEPAGPDFEREPHP